MMFRRVPGQQDDADLLEARRRLMLGVDSVNSSTGAGDLSEQQFQLYREQQILRDARAAAALGTAGAAGPGANQSMSSNPNQQQFGSSNTSSTFPSFQQQQQQQQQQSSMEQQMLQLQQQQLQQQQQFLSGNNGNNGMGNGSNVSSSMIQAMDNSERRSNSSYANMLSEQRLAIQRAQLEVQRHAQAQAQAEARVKALLGQEAQVQDQMRLLRQRQLQSPSTQTTTSLSASAYDMMLSSPQGRSFPATAGDCQLDNARLGNMNMTNANVNRATSLMVGTRQQQQQQQQTNSGLPTSLNGDEATLFGKISRQTSDQLVTDVVLQQQRGNNIMMDNSEKNKRQQQDGDNAKEEQPESSDEEEEDLDDEEYFKVQAGEPGADGGYPVAREAFPIKLYRILYEAEKNQQHDIISFFPHGRAFAVHKSKEFTRDIMPKYFPAGRMNTFLKQLNLYGFRRITEGRDKGGYFHKDFLKGKRHLCKKIKRKKVHVNKPAPPAPVSHAHFQLQQGSSSSSMQQAFLDHHSSLGGALGHGHHQLLQQQQMALGLSTSASNGTLFPGSANNALFNAATTSSDLNFMQDQTFGGAGGSSRLGQSNTTFNLGNFNPNNNHGGMMNHGMNPNLR